MSYTYSLNPLVMHVKQLSLCQLHGCASQPITINKQLMQFLLPNDWNSPTTQRMAAVHHGIALLWKVTLPHMYLQRLESARFTTLITTL